MNSHVQRIQAAIANADSKHNMFQMFFNSEDSLPTIQNRKFIIIDHAILVSGLIPSELELAVLTILRPHFRIQDGASLVSAEELEGLATLSPRDEADQRRVQTMLRRKVTAQHIDRPGWLHVFPVVPYALATLRIASSQIDMAWIESEMRSSLVIDVEEWGVEPQCETRDDERE